jgi:hypothetical protein
LVQRWVGNHGGFNWIGVRLVLFCYDMVRARFFTKRAWLSRLGLCL